MRTKNQTTTVKQKNQLPETTIKVNTYIISKSSIGVLYRNNFFDGSDPLILRSINGKLYLEQAHRVRRTHISEKFLKENFRYWLDEEWDYRDSCEKVRYSDEDIYNWDEKLYKKIKTETIIK